MVRISISHKSIPMDASLLLVSLTSVTFDHCFLVINQLRGMLQITALVASAIAT
jgi:hypothetical protein